MEVRIREAERGDLPQIIKIERVSFSMPWSYWAFERDMRSDKAHLFVAEIGEEVVGYVDIQLAGKVGHIANIAVAPEHRRKGIGRMLLSHTLSFARSNGAEKVWLEVRRTNIPAQKLYAKLGFKLVGIRKGYYTDTGEDALLMEVELI